MSRWKLVGVGLFAVLLLRFACEARRGDAPDDKIARNFREMCKIAERGIEHPEDGVRRLMRYHGDHAPEMLESFGALLVAIERIDDDRRHDARARLARDRMRAPVLECARTWSRFGDAVEANPRARETLERGVTRLNRTLEILFGDRRSLGWRAAFPTSIDLDAATGLP